MRMLMNDGDSGAACRVGRRQRDRRAVYADLPVVWADDAGQDLDQRRFTGAVFADQRVDRSCGDAQIDLVQSGHARVAFGQS